LYLGGLLLKGWEGRREKERGEEGRGGKGRSSPPPFALGRKRKVGAYALTGLGAEPLVYMYSVKIFFLSRIAARTA